MKLLDLLGSCKPRASLALVLTVSLLAGCWDESDDFPLPTPTPTPTPFPNPLPTPAPGFTPFPIPTPFVTPFQSTSGDVVLANAELMETASKHSAQAAAALETLLTRPGLTEENLVEARSLLAAARKSFAVAEISLSYSNVENPAERTPSIPADPSRIHSSFAELDATLSNRLEKPTAASSDPLALAKTIRTELDGLADAWDANALGNYRNKSFLNDPDAVGRIFRGLVATADQLAQSGSHEVDSYSRGNQISALKVLLEGKYPAGSEDHVAAGNGILSLIAAKDAETAEAIELELSTLVEENHSNHKLPSESSSTTSSLHERLLKGANSLGYEF